METDERITISLPFNIRFKESMLKEQKTWTSRARQYGKVGYIFQVFGRTFVITDIRQMYLKQIANSYYYEEGFDSPQEFIAFWKIIHPRKGYEPNQIIYAHNFRLEIILED